MHASTCPCNYVNEHVQPLVVFSDESINSFWTGTMYGSVYDMHLRSLLAHVSQRLKVFDIRRASSSITSKDNPPPPPKLLAGF